MSETPEEKVFIHVEPNTGAILGYYPESRVYPHLPQDGVRVSISDYRNALQTRATHWFQDSGFENRGPPVMTEEELEAYAKNTAASHAPTKAGLLLQIEKLREQIAALS